jgi:hypothetical protein
MKKFAIGVGGLILAILLVIVLDQFGFALGLWDVAFWGVKTQNARRQVFVETQSYVQGKIQNIGQECFAFRKADGSQRSALAGEIRNEASTIDLTKLPADEQSCVQEAREQ